MPVLALLLVAVPPAVSVVHSPDAPCVTLRIDGRAPSGGPIALCLHDAVGLVVEGRPAVAVLLEAPHRLDAALRHRVFVYTVSGGRLTPRFLGSGFKDLDIDALSSLEGGAALGLVVHDATRRFELRCAFREFPLECDEVTP